MTDNNSNLIFFPNKAWWRSRTDATLVAERKIELQKYMQSLIKVDNPIVIKIIKEWIDPSNNPTHNSLSKPEKDGYLSKEGHILKTWKKRWFVLKGNFLYYFKDNSLSNLRGVISLKDVTIKEAPGKEHPYCFAIRKKNTFGETTFLSSSNKKDYKEWLNLLKVVTSSMNISSDIPNERKTDSVSPKLIRRMTSAQIDFDPLNKNNIIEQEWEKIYSSSSIEDNSIEGYKRLRSSSDPILKEKKYVFYIRFVRFLISFFF